MDKTLIRSKTFWLNVIMAVTPLFPVADAFIKAHLTEFGLLWGFLGVVLRLVTKDKITLT